VSRLTNRNVKELIEMLENELNSVSTLDRIEKTKMRSKIRKQSRWLLAFGNPTPEKIIKKLAQKLPDLFSLYPYGFFDMLKEEIILKMAITDAECRRKVISRRLSVKT
jgi:hypothetical protein